MKKTVTKEQTDAGSAGAYDGGQNFITKREFTETILAGADYVYDTPFAHTTNNPLKIDGVKSIKKSRAVKDKNFPKFGGEGAKFVTINDKCKKFPYCNQGDPQNIKLMEEIITEVSKERNIPETIIREIIDKELKSDIY